MTFIISRNPLGRIWKYNFLRKEMQVVASENDGIPHIFHAV